MLDALEAARAARARAYAPYSGYSVGSAIVDDAGTVHVGCNVENVSFGATMCAERNALARMVAEGGRALRRVVVATADGGAPCGICLQSLMEFAPEPSEVEVELTNDGGEVSRHTLAELMPRSFISKGVHRAASEE